MPRDIYHTSLETTRKGHLTHLVYITIQAPASNETLIPKGALLVPVSFTTHSLKTPLQIATMLFNVLILPNVPLRLFPYFSNSRAWKSVTIQLSNTEKRREVETPPKMRPRKSRGREGERIVRRQDRE